MSHKTVEDSATLKVWLLELAQKVQRKYTTKKRMNLTGNTCDESFTECVRPLTQEEFEQFLLVAPNFVLEPFTVYGFNFGIILYEMPAQIGISPEYIFAISGEYLPENLGQGFESAWTALSPLSHSKQNTTRLAYYGMQPPQEKSFYEY